MRLDLLEPVPVKYRANFAHLYLDAIGFGVLSASAIAFVTIYATRQGADAVQVGMLTAGPAIVNLIFALPTGRWLEGQPVDTAVFWSSVFHRFFYLFWIWLPMVLSPAGQVWALIGLTFLMSIPATGLAVGFNSMFGEAVPPEWRGPVTGVRNALMAVALIITSVVCGEILIQIPFPTGYQVVFGIGLVGAALSSLHLYSVRTNLEDPTPLRPARRLTAMRWPSMLGTLRAGLGKGSGHGEARAHLLRTEILRSSFGPVVALMFGFHLAQYLAIPIFPLYFVRELHLNDQWVSLGSAAFYVTNFLGAIVAIRWCRWLGHQRVTAIGAMLMASYPGLVAASHEVVLYMIASLCGGLGWAVASGAFLNYILDKAPSDDRPAYMAWYNMALNAAILVGSLGGPLLADYSTLSTALALAAFGRLVMGICIWRWG